MRLFVGAGAGSSDLRAVLDTLRASPPAQPVSLCLWARAGRARSPLSVALRSSAREHACHLALAETTGIAIRWVDGIVSGRADDVADFLTTVAPALDRAHGRCVVAAAA